MTVILRDGEGFEELLRRFKTQVVRSGVLQEVKKKRYFRSKGAMRREKERDAARRRRRKERRQAR